ncbi:nad h-hydrate epimerase-like [Nannochloropsis oceanica]
MEPSSDPSSPSPPFFSWRQRITLLTQKEAQAIDEELMSTPGFSVDQLMELAGLSVSHAVDHFLQQPARSASILILCGPGNNGGDGLVAARHLFHLGYCPVVVYPKRSNKPLFVNLVKQCEDLGVEVGVELPGDIEGRFDCVIDALFGFGTKGALRAPFDAIMQRLTEITTPIVSVDIPSGWDVEQGDVYHTSFMPEALVSLTAPKRCAAFFRGRHYLGGRFVPPKMKVQYRLDEEHLPAYQGIRQFVEIEGWDEEGAEGGGERGTGGEDIIHKSLTPTPVFLPPSSISTATPSDEATGRTSGPTHTGTSTGTTSPQHPEFVVVWITAPNPAEAAKLAEGLVHHDLAACVNLVPNIESVYKWEGKVERSGEVLMMAKTRGSLLGELSAFVLKHHSYEVPETIAAGIVGGGDEYLQWLRDSTRKPKEEAGREVK